MTWSAISARADFGAGNRNHGSTKCFCPAAEFVEFLRPATLRKGKNQVIGLQDAQPSVQAVGWRQVERGCPADRKNVRGASSRRSRRAAASDQHLALVAGNQPCGPDEPLVERVARRANGRPVRFNH